jgi:hypothetical protein
MSEFITLGVAYRQASELTQSALPDAPVILTPDTASTHVVRGWVARRIRALATHGHHLADQLDPACP